jgi:hypothetical protein
MRRSNKEPDRAHVEANRALFKGHPPASVAPLAGVPWGRIARSVPANTNSVQGWRVNCNPAVLLAPIRVAERVEPRSRSAVGAMITSEGFGLIAELIAAVLLIAALTGIAIQRSQAWLVGLVIAFMMLIVAMTVVVESST